MNAPRFDLWRDPWISVQDAQGQVRPLGLGDALRKAHTVRAVVEPSPLAIVGIHRLLVAILQDALAPQSDADLVALWWAGCVPEEPLAAFAAQYSARFDLFSPTAPFLQSADLGLTPTRDDRVKTVLYLHPDWPAATEVTHYRHGVDTEAALCPACAAAGLVAQPAFATSGGAGIRPSINGVPPIYVLPQGETLFHSLVASLTTPAYQPTAADRDEDQAWWRRCPIVGKSAVVERVGYLHSLTFAARQVRLHPTPSEGQPCSRCGAVGEWLVRTMVYNMGESRPKDAPWWRDPFVAYRQNAKGEPVPLRPQAGRAIWRDYGALLLALPPSGSGASTAPGTIPVRVLDQVDAVTVRLGRLSDEVLHVRCIGLRTDGKAKIFEWIDQGLDVPASLLHGTQAGFAVQQGLAFAEEVGRTLRRIWRRHFGGERWERHASLGQRLIDDYWQALADPFQHHALLWGEVTDEDAEAAATAAWARTVIAVAERAFLAASAQLGDAAATLRQRIQAETHCRAALITQRKEFFHE